MLCVNKTYVYGTQKHRLANSLNKMYLPYAETELIANYLPHTPHQSFYFGRRTCSAQRVRLRLLSRLYYLGIKYIPNALKKDALLIFGFDLFCSQEPKNLKENFKVLPLCATYERRRRIQMWILKDEAESSHWKKAIFFYTPQPFSSLPYQMNALIEATKGPTKHTYNQTCTLRLIRNTGSFKSIA